MPFEPGFREIGADELVRYLIHTSGQDEGASIDPMPILDLLGLQHLSLDFQHELPEVLVAGAECPRALLSFQEKVIATAHDLDEKRARFSAFHEIGHYVLPQHVEDLVLCTDTDMSHRTPQTREQEANVFAAAIMFHGDRFRTDANAHPISATTVKELAEAYKASFEATARRIAETSLRPCMLIVYNKARDDRRIATGYEPAWDVQYCVASPSFAIQFFTEVRSDPDNQYVMAAQLAEDIASSVVAEIMGTLSGKGSWRFRAEYFHNTYKVFCLLTPVGEEV